MIHPAWVALSLIPQVSIAVIQRLIDYFGDVDTILSADEDQLRQVYSIGKKRAAAIRQIDLDTLCHKIDHWQSQNVQIIPYHSSDYPSILRQLPDAPPTLFVLGNLSLTDWDISQAFNIVGTRQPADESRKVAYRLGLELAKRGYTIVSGLAHGIDTAAHHGALRKSGAQTIAILGCGVLNIYPRENRTLAVQMMQRGGLISEFAPDARPNAGRLVARNRLISALSSATIIVESAIDGGAMHTVRFAQAQGRIIYAIDNSASANRTLLDAHIALPLNYDLKGLPF